MTTPTTFAAFAALGYPRLVPIVPIDAIISDRSSMAKRKDARGKAVGVRGQDGKFFGFDWLPYEADERDYVRWQAMGCGIGIKTGQGLILIDADTLNEAWAEIIRDTVTKHFGKLSARVGRYPKVGYPLRVSEPIRYTRIEFGELDDKGRLKDRVEILSDGRQFVAHGLHPFTGKPYTWPRALVPYDQLPVVAAASVIALLEELRTLLPAAKPLIHEGAEGSSTEVDQRALVGDPVLVRKAVEATPNTSEAFPTRESYLSYGYAIRAALPAEPDTAFDIFAEWCSRWQEGENEPPVVEADWRRMKPPFRRGAGWLYELAEQHAPQAFDRTEVWFQPIAEDDSPFAPQKIEQNAFEPPVAIKWVDPAEWHGVEPAPRKWIIAGMIPDGEVTLLTGAGGVGKTLLAHGAATAVSRGLPFLGRETVQGKVMAFLCEDSEDELQIRQHDINNSLCLNMQDVSPNLRIASRKFMDNLLCSFDRSTGAMKRSAVWGQLCADAKAYGAKLVIVDTIADTFGGSEIDRSQVRQFVQSCLGRLAQEIGGAVLALGHPSKAGQTSGDGTSGSTAWHASVRSRLYLTHAAKDGSGPFRRLENKKANYGPQGDVFMLRWSRGTFELVTAKTVGAVTSAIAGGDAGVAGSAAVGAPVSDMADTIDEAILVAVASLATEGAALSDARNSSNWAPKVLSARFPDMLGLYGEKDVEAGWQRAVTAGRVVGAVVGRKPDRKPIQGYRIAEAGIEAGDVSASVFE